MKLKKIFLTCLVTFFIYSMASSQCQITGALNFYNNNVCAASSVTLGVSATLLKPDAQGVLQPCGGQVSAQLQKFTFPSTWTNMGTPLVMPSGTGLWYGMGIPSTWGSGIYRVVISNPAGNCSCATTTSYASAAFGVTFTSSHTNSYSINGTPTNSTTCIRICDTTQILMNSISMTNPNAISTVNTWRIGTANDQPNFTSIVWTTLATGTPPTSYNLVPLLGTNHPGPINGKYRIYLETYNGCNTYQSYSCLDIDMPPAFLVGQKYDASNYTTISAGTTCSSPFTNICPVYTAPYSYMMTALNTAIPSYQVTNSQWSCTLEEVPVSNCAATPALVFTTSYATIGSMSNLDNIDLNALAVAAGFPANYITSLKRYKFTLNIKYSCGNVYTFVCWLRYTTAGCRIMNKEEESYEALNNSISLFPNPVSDILEIKTDNTIQSVILTDISGKEIKAELKNNTIDFSKLNAGVYVIKVYTNEGVSIKKVVKQD